MATVSRHSQVIAAIVAVASGLLVAYMIHAHPEGLRVPAWVAYVAASAFGFAGLCLFAGAVGSIALQRWLGVAATASLFLVGTWVAFGPGERACSFSLPFLQSGGGDAACRGAFAIGAILVGLFLALALHRIIRNRPEA
jgi:hypothetical protein